MKLLLNIVAMQISWFACVLGAANQLPWLGVCVSLVVVTVHLIRTWGQSIEWKLIPSALAIGFVLDSALSLNGLISFVSGSVVNRFTTPWMLGLWIGFATALTTSLKWFMSRPVFAILFGALGGPLAYWSGAKLGAIQINDVTTALLCIGLGWGAAMGIFSTLVRRFTSDSREPALV